MGEITTANFVFFTRVTYPAPDLCLDSISLVLSAGSDGSLLGYGF
jgi:hypothetical protein